MFHAFPYSGPVVSISEFVVREFSYKTLIHLCHSGAITAGKIFLCTGVLTNAQPFKKRFLLSVSRSNPASSSANRSPPYCVHICCSPASNCGMPDTVTRSSPKGVIHPHFSSRNVRTSRSGCGIPNGLLSRSPGSGSGSPAHYLHGLFPMTQAEANAGRGIFVAFSSEWVVPIQSI